MMSNPYAKRTTTIPKSFIREILKVTENPEVISFAGGLPNPRFFPVKEIANAAAEVLNGADVSALQYSTTEGYQPLREYIAHRYRQKKGLEVSADEILITNGSQQGLDLVGKIFIDKDDVVVIERPAYLGAIQAFRVYEPRFCVVPLLEDGININCLRDTLCKHRIKLFHTVINFQNPSGISYSQHKREELAKVRL
jgi:2-aminoadipate transaminase